MNEHRAWCPRCEQDHCCVIEVRQCAELAKLTPVHQPAHDCIADDNLGCLACKAEGAPERISRNLGGLY